MEPLAKLDLKTLLAAFPKRAVDAHKGNFGHVLIIGGGYGYPGAPVLAALGALRVGAGLVTLASHKDHLLGLNAMHPEIMCHAIDEPLSLTTALTRATVVVLGPGLGRDAWAQQVYEIAASTHLPLVLDADGLFFLAQRPTSNPNRVLTPHPGEAARLLDSKLPILDIPRIDAINKIIEKYSSTVVLKGADSLVGSKDGEIACCDAGNPGMASGGMGDLLSGVIGGLLAQKLSLDLAAKLGVCVHAMAGDIAAQNGQRGIVATDLLLPIQQLIG